MPIAGQGRRVEELGGFGCGYAGLRAGSYRRLQVNDFVVVIAQNGFVRYFLCMGAQGELGGSPWTGGQFRLTTGKAEVPAGFAQAIDRKATAGTRRIIVPLQPGIATDPAASGHDTFETAWTAFSALRRFAKRASGIRR